MLSYFLGCSRAWFMKVVQKYIGREPSGRTFNEIALDYNGQPHNPMVCAISNLLQRWLNYFETFFPGQQWCHHVCFSSSVHGQTRADCFREVWICPPFLLKVAFHLASCIIESSITNWTSPKKGETTWQIGWSPHCARLSDLSIPRRLGGGTFAQCWRRHDICKQKKLCHRSFGAKKIRRKSVNPNIC